MTGTEGKGQRRPGSPSGAGATDPAAPDADAGESADDLDLAKLAAALRRVIPRVDDASRERLEAAWVAVTNAMKQPRVDSVRLRKRLQRLRAELDGLGKRFSRDGDPHDTPG